jgi:metal-responsive CopG/Arc/MetJ family transcriptional regulator
MKPGPSKAKETVTISLWVAASTVKAIDEASAAEDSDRSKFVRRALRHHLKELNICYKETEKQR